MSQQNMKLFYPTWCNNLPPYTRQVVTVDGSLEISDSFLVTWSNMKCDVFGIKEMLHYNITSKKISSLHNFEKNGLWVKIVTTSPGLPYGPF